ncbi:MAG: ABC transporter ATP-binding protein [bacterium]|nr:ABC transporter ATP-binding protein [bacterium]
MRNLTQQTLKTFWHFSKKYPWQVAFLIFGVIGLTGLSIYIPLVYRDLINVLASGAPREHFSAAVDLIVLILVLNISRIALWRTANFVNNNFQPAVMRDLINACYRYLNKHSTSFFSSNFVGSLVTKVKRYERAYEQISDQIVHDLGRSLLEIGMVLAVLLWQYPRLGLVALAWCVIFLVTSYAYSRFKLPYDVQKAKSDTLSTAQLADSITNNGNIKLFSNWRLENDRFGNVTQQQFLLRRKSWNLGTVGDLAQGSLMLILEFYVMYLALTLWRADAIGVGDVALLQAYLVRIFDKLWGTGRNIRNIYEALADANEMTEMLLTPHEVQDAADAATLRVQKGQIVFDEVAFGYHKETSILKDFNLAIAPGERIALIGPSGGGKSTIIKLLFRFYDVTGGSIYIDGQDIARVTQDSLRDALSLVPQEPILFHRTLMENIRYAKPHATDEEIIRASSLAHAHEFISEFPGGYNTLVGERGIKLSGGERQRVAIARAILKDAPILVLDEATSSLDSESELFIQDALKNLMQNHTTIVIAHRLSTIMQMDRIIVIDDGGIIEEGKHEELLHLEEGVYQKLWGIQAGGFVSAANAADMY